MTLDPNNFNTLKESVALFVVYKQKILFMSYQNQGTKVYDVFGTFVESGQDREEVILGLEKEYFATSFSVSPMGTIISYINKPKPDGRVKLVTGAYIIKLTDKQKEVLVLKDGFVWFGVEDIRSSEWIREDNKMIFTRAIEKGEMNIVLEVDQMGLWGKAKLIDWSESSE